MMILVLTSVRVISYTAFLHFYLYPGGTWFSANFCQVTFNLVKCH